MGQSACSCGPDRCGIIMADIVYQSGTDFAFSRGGGMISNGIPRTPSGAGKLKVIGDLTRTECVVFVRDGPSFVFNHIGRGRGLTIVSPDSCVL